MWRQLNRWIIHPVAWVIVMLAVFAFVSFKSAPPSQSDAGFTVTSFDGDYSVSEQDGKLRLEVVETITVQFLQWGLHGIERTLPTVYGDSDLGLTDVSVTDENGNPVRATTRSHGQAGSSDVQDGTVSVRIGDASQTVRGGKTYVLHYAYTNAMVGTRDGQELYFDVNGTGWVAGIGAITATVHLDPALTDSLTGAQSCYRGAAGSTRQCAISRTGDGFRVSETDFAAGQNVTIAIGFRPGTVATTIQAPGTPPGLLLWAPPAIALLALVIALGVRHSHRHPRLLRREPVPVNFVPPAKLSPLVAADFLGYPANGMAAWLTQLVWEGRARILQDEPAGDDASAPPLRVVLGAEDEFSGREWDALAPFSGGPGGVRLDEARSPEALERSAKARTTMFSIAGLRLDSSLPSVLLYGGVIGLYAVGLLAFVAGEFTNADDTKGLVRFLLVGVISCLGVIAASYYAPTHGRMTDRGKKVLIELEGLREFITMAEADRIRVLSGVDASSRSDEPAGAGGVHQVEITESLLPWAIVFGCEDSWRRAIGELRASIPQVQLPDIELPTVEIGREMGHHYRRYQRRYDTDSNSFFATRSPFGQGPVSTGISDLLDGWSSTHSRDGDGGGSGWGGGVFTGGGSSFSGGSHGGGHSGGGIGGGGGRAW